MSNKKIDSVLYGAIRLVKSNFGFCIVEIGHQTLGYIFNKYGYFIDHSNGHFSFHSFLVNKLLICVCFLPFK